MIFSDISKHLNHETMVEVHRVITSTNDIASSYEDGKRHLVIADCQTNGHGRMGRSFYSPAETGLYFSYKFYPENNCIAYLTPAAAVFICDEIKAQTGLNAGIKWVNDIYLNNKKICGILTQLHNDSFGSAVTIGIGLNVTTEAFPAEISGTAGCLGTEIDRSRFICSIINSIEGFSIISGNIILEKYKNNQILLNKRITFYQNGKEFNCIALDIDNDCGLIVLNDDGTKTKLSSGEITLHKD